MITFGGQSLLTRTEAAARLGCSISTLDRRIREGAIAFREYEDGRVLVPLDEVEAYIRRRLGPLRRGRPAVLRELESRPDETTVAL